MVMGGKDAFGLLHQRNSNGLLQEIKAQITAEHIAKLAAPRAVSGRFLSVRVFAIAARAGSVTHPLWMPFSDVRQGAQPGEASSTSLGDSPMAMTP